MANTVQEIYTQFISNLPSAERLQLATLILNGLVQQESTAVDDSDIWTEQDQFDLAAYSLQHAATSFPDEEEIAE
jgi:hypothetical protein